MPAPLQTRLLRVLQEEEIRRLGDTKTIDVDVRIIAATSRDLDQDIKLGKFRNDLFYRINVLPIHIPPLRERTEDIKFLVEHFVKKFKERLNPKVGGVSQDVLSELLKYPWYGNVRELENVIERAVILTDSDVIQSVDLGTSHEKFERDILDDSLTLEEAWRRLEKAYIEKALSDAKGNRTKAAKLLGLSRRALLYKLKDFRENREK